MLCSIAEIMGDKTNPVSGSKYESVTMFTTSALYNLVLCCNRKIFLVSQMEGQTTAGTNCCLPSRIGSRLMVRLFHNIDFFFWSRRLKSLQGPKLLLTSADDSTRKHMLGSTPSCILVFEFFYLIYTFLNA